ncbi:DUF418 domain-containing protein [Hydrocarboniclastica marina]|nr:DUF418 domain-containing protein [Hydrocarboniclastica marina]
MAQGKGKGRLEVVDAVRALALFGVLVMNLRDMSGLNFLAPEAFDAVQGPIGHIVDFMLLVLLDEKFLSAFSFLFGLSFYLLLERKSDQPGFRAMYFRRLTALGVFGLINVGFLYWADILLIYAIFGATLVFFVRLPQRLLLTTAALFLFGAPALLAMLGAAENSSGQLPSDVRALSIFGGAPYWEQVQYGLVRYFGTSESSLVEIWDHTNVFGMLLLGLWAGRAQIPHQIEENRRFLRLLAASCIPLGLTAGLVRIGLPEPSVVATAARAGAPILAVGYMSLAALLLSHPGAAGVRLWLSAPGKLALTNYLAYGLIGQALFYSWGLGWLGTVGSAGILLLSIAVYTLLALASQLWLKPFRMGPTEWLWRCLTYLRLEPLRRH